MMARKTPSPARTKAPIRSWSERPAPGRPSRPRSPAARPPGTAGRLAWPSRGSRRGCPCRRSGPGGGSAIRSATRSANSMSCVTTMAVSQTPVRSSAISSATSRALVGSRPAVGSSKRTSSGSITSARAMPTRLRIPPDSSAGSEVVRPGQADERQKAVDAVGNLAFDWTACARGAGRRRSRRRTASRRARRPGTRSPSGAAAAAAPPRACARSACRRAALRPASGRIKPAAMRRSTVLPEPLPPMTVSVRALGRARRSRRAAPRCARTTSARPPQLDDRRRAIATPRSPEQEEEELREEEVRDDHRPSPPARRSPSSTRPSPSVPPSWRARCSSRSA